MEGRLRYWLSVSTLRTTLETYAEQNRSMVAQQLRLTPDQKLSLALALTDSLTGLYNHRYFQERLDRAIDRVTMYDIRDRLTKKQYEIYDVLIRAGERGYTWSQLEGMFYKSILSYSLPTLKSLGAVMPPPPGSSPRAGSPASRRSRSSAGPG